MGGIRKRKRQQHGPSTSDARASNRRSYFDLFVPLPKKKSAAGTLLIRQMLERFGETGFTQVALTHTIYGPPRPAEDNVSTTIQIPFNDVLDQRTTTKAKPTPSLVFRIHAVVENLSDVGLYALKGDQSTSNPVQELLSQYDLVSLSPRNDATFRAACSSATAAEIITLDYAAGRGGNQLPFRITKADVKAVMARNAVFEIPYTGILNRNQRRGLIQTCRMLQSASLGLRPKVIFSSGDRTLENEDMGVLALRTPGDLINLLNTILAWDSSTAIDALSNNGSFAVKRGRERRFGKTMAVEVLQDDVARAESDSPATGELPSEDPPRCVADTPDEAFKQGDDDSEHLGEDGFISF